MASAASSVMSSRTRRIVVLLIVFSSAMNDSFAWHAAGRGTCDRGAARELELGAIQPVLVGHFGERDAMEQLQDALVDQRVDDAALAELGLEAGLRVAHTLDDVDGPDRCLDDPPRSDVAGGARQAVAAAVAALAADEN